MARIVLILENTENRHLLNEFLGPIILSGSMWPGSPSKKRSIFASSTIPT